MTSSLFIFVKSKLLKVGLGQLAADTQPVWTHVSSAADERGVHGGQTAPITMSLLSQANPALPDRTKAELPNGLSFVELAGFLLAV